MQKLSPSYANKLLCLIDTTKPDLFFSLVDYRNNYFTSDYPNKIIEFYNGFENRDQLIQWMKERPMGVANIHEIDGDKDIIVVITTADFKGKYAKECRENIFKGLHMVFVESGGREDFYFNYAHNCNVGTKKAMEYNPKWIVISNGDMYKMDDIDYMKEELDNADGVFLVKNEKVDPKAIIGEPGIRSIPWIVHAKRRWPFHKERLTILSRFNSNYEFCTTTFLKMIYKRVISYNHAGSFLVLDSYSVNRYIKLHSNLYDEVFINSGEDIDLSLMLKGEAKEHFFENYNIGTIGSGTMSYGAQRGLRDILGFVYLDSKWNFKNLKENKT